jgi:hypothetical protein
MKRLVLLVVTGFCLMLISTAAAGQQARRFDEFGELDREDVRQRTQQFALTLKTEQSSAATVIVYGGLRSSVNDVTRLANWPYYVLLEAGIAQERISLVNGGYREEPLIELWVVEKGAAGPDASPMNDPSEVVPALTLKRVDTLVDLLPEVKIFHKRLDWLNAELADNPKASAYLIAYGSDKVKAAEAAKLAARAKLYTGVHGKIPVQRVVVKTAPGLHELARVEIWLVPAGSKPPEIIKGTKPAKTKPKTTSKKKS